MTALHRDAAGEVARSNTLDEDHDASQRLNDQPIDGDADTCADQQREPGADPHGQPGIALCTQEPLILGRANLLLEGFDRGELLAEGIEELFARIFALDPDGV